MVVELIKLLFTIVVEVLYYIILIAHFLNKIDIGYLLVASIIYLGMLLFRLLTDKSVHLTNYGAFKFTLFLLAIGYCIMTMMGINLGIYF